MYTLFQLYFNSFTYFLFHFISQCVIAQLSGFHFSEGKKRKCASFTWKMIVKLELQF